MGKRLNHFIIKHVGLMDIHCISTQVSDFLLLQHPDAQGAQKETVQDHIEKHMLHPRVRIAVLLRQLLEFSTFLHSSLIIQDGGMCTVEKSNSELYLKVIGQIMQLYRADPGSMLFAEEEDDGEETAGSSNKAGHSSAKMHSNAASSSSSSAAPSK